jgi:hypothetical protein
MQDLWAELKRVEARLTTELTNAHRRTAELYRKIRDVRAKIGAFRSGESRQRHSAFEKTA